MQKNKRNQGIDRHGMTLLEIMVVLIIVVLVMGLAVRAFWGQRDVALRQTTYSYILTLADAVARYEVTVGQPPTTEQGLAALVAPPSDLRNPASWAGPYIDARSTIIDPWGNEYQYMRPGRDGRRFDIWSFGPDGIPDTEDDIRSW